MTAGLIGVGEETGESVFRATVSHIIKSKGVIVGTIGVK
jgi:hypothetical protein